MSHSECGVAELMTTEENAVVFYLHPSSVYHHREYAAG